MNKQELDKETLLKNCDWNGNKLDISSIHPKNIYPLMQAGFILSIDDEDSGRNSFYILTDKGAEVLGS